MAKAFLRGAVTQFDNGFITHEDRALLNFRCLDFGVAMLVVVQGLGPDITAWANRVGGLTQVTQTQADAFMADRLADWKTRRVAELDAEKTAVQSQTVETV